MLSLRIFKESRRSQLFFLCSFLVEKPLSRDLVEKRNDVFLYSANTNDAPFSIRHCQIFTFNKQFLILYSREYFTEWSCSSFNVVKSFKYIDE